MKDLIEVLLKAQNILKIIVILILVTSCSSNKKIITNNEVLNYIIKKSNGSIYYKTITKDGGKPIESYVNSKYLEFYLCIPKIKIPIKLEENNIDFLKEKFRKNKKINLKTFSKNVTIKKVKHKTFYISQPVLFKNNTMAIYYSTGTYGGEFNLLQKKDNKWQQICSTQVWIE